MHPSRAFHRPRPRTRAGDFAYNLEDEKGGVGDGYMRLLEPVISKVPYMGAYTR